MEKQNYNFRVFSRRTNREIEFKNCMRFPSITEEMARGIASGIRIGLGRDVYMQVEIDGKVYNW